MLAVACLQVSAKYEEAEENVPAVNQLSRASGIPLTVQVVQKWEVLALESLGTFVCTSLSLGTYRPAFLLFVSSCTHHIDKDTLFCSRCNILLVPATPNRLAIDVHCAHALH